MPDLFGETSSFYTGNNVVNITQSWTGTTPSLLGPVAFTQSSQTEFFDGELSGSNILVTNGELNPSNPVKQPSTQILNYESTGSFNTNPGVGQFFWQYAVKTKVPEGQNPIGVKYIYINTTDLNGININEALQNLNAGDTINVTLRAEYDGGEVGGPLTLIITNTTRISNNIWLLEFNQNLTSLAPDNIGFTYLDILSVVGLNPFINDVANFTNSDYNAIINNAVISRPNDKFFDVDFSSNQITAVNETSIISASRGIGFATPSTVPQSNYTTRRIISPRYIGKELTSAEFNEYTGPTTNFTSSLGLQTNFYPGDISYGKTSNVGNPAVNFVYFEDLRGTSPEWGSPGRDGKTFVNIRYIIDENGNAISPINDIERINLGTIQQTFNGIDDANILLDDDDIFGVNFGGLNGLQSIFKSGYRIDPILYTQSGSTAEDAISFYDGLYNNNAANRFWLSASEAPNLDSGSPKTPNQIFAAPASYAMGEGINKFIGFQQIDIENSGFSPITNPFNPQLYDEIRFEGLEENSFVILNISYVTFQGNPSEMILVLTLDRNIPEELNLGYFLLRRYTPDPSSILLNITKGSGATSPGILTPEYLSPELNSRIPSIIDNLKSKNII